jgi:hypothetical protein
MKQPDYGSIYGTVDHVAKKKKKKDITVNFMICSTASSVLCFATLSIVSFGPFSHPGLTVFAVVTFFLLSCGTLAFWRRQWILLPLGGSCLVAVICGASVGLYCYGTYGFFALLYDHSRVYHNVVPSTSAGSVADAGRIIFEVGAKVDQHHAVGYGGVTGDRYCAAPIRGPSTDEAAHVEFWAVGMNCCAWQGEFICDDATDAKAHSGVVVMDGPDFFGASNRDRYELTRKKAEARWGITSSQSPVYVRWVNNDNLGLLATHYRWKAWTSIALATLLFSALCVPFLYIAVKLNPHDWK